MNAKALPGWMLIVALAIAGCESERTSGTHSQAVDLFSPTAMRVHPIFTQIADWSHSGKPDGIEAQLEFTDQFGDPTKASGKVLFELFDYHKDSPDPRGKRLGWWPGSLITLAEQRDRWNTTLRTYRFQLDFPAVQSSQSYVLSAVFESAAGGRFFNSIVLPAREADKNEHKNKLETGHLGLGAE